MASKCEGVAAELSLGLGSELSAEAMTHCASCAACQTARRESSELRESIGRLKRAGDDEMQGIDLSARLLETVQTQRQAPSWRNRFVFAAAFACLVLAIWKWPTTQSRVAISLDAPAGVQLVQGEGEDRRVEGKGIPLALPLTLATQQQGATLHIASSTIDIAPKSRVSLDAQGTLHLASGIIEIHSSSEQPLSPIQLTGDVLPTLTLRGHALIEHQPGTSPMQLLKRHKIAAASAVAAIVLYSGYATIRSADSEKTLDSPTGLYVDEDGVAHSFDPTKTKAASGLAALANVATHASEEGAETEKGFLPSGAYWSDSEQVVQFRIRGEAFDGDTGKALDSFELKAALLESGDFGQRDAVIRSFSKLPEGRFVLDGLGVGTWRITATREGYAPVIQTLDIADLQATPYLVIPLSPSGAKLSGSVIDWQGRPVSEAQIGLANCLQGKRVAKPKAGCNLVTSDIHGRFVLDKLPEEEVYSLYARHDRYGFATSSNLRSSFEEDAGQHITIRLSGVIRIYGRVVQGKEQTPVGSAIVEGAGGKAQTSATGDYELIVPLEENPEAHVVSYPGSSANLAIHSYPADRSVRPLEWVDAQDHAAQVRIDFFLDVSNASLVGTIRNGKGKPMAGLELQLTNTNGWKRDRGHQTFPTKAITDAGGNYRVDHIPSEAGYQVHYRADEEQDWQELGYVNIPKEGEVRADFQIGSASVRGRFVSSDSGEPMKVAQMSCSRLGAERSDQAGVFTLAHCYPDGRFEFAGLQPGTYVLHSKTEWMSSAVTLEPTTVELAAGQFLTDVEVKVEGEGAQLWRFRILSTENEFLAGAYIRYRVGSSSTTANLHIGDDGIASQQINDSIKEILLEVPGYEPKQVVLSEHSPDKVLEVKLAKLE